jgi:intracellular septation protein A
MRRSWLLGLRAALEFVVKNFVPPIAFFIVFKGWGSKPAIAVAIAMTVLQLGFQFVKNYKLSPFFLTAATFTLVFGGMDLVVSEPRYYRLAPFAENFIMASAFLGTVLLGKPLALWFAQALPPQMRPDLSLHAGTEMERYLHRVTLVWIAYFFAKSFLFLYLAFVVDLGRLIVLRAIIGNASLVLMFGGEIFYRKKLRRAASGVAQLDRKGDGELREVHAMRRR